MHTTPIKSENVYLTFSDLYKKYIPATTNFFEGDIYERKENGRHKIQLFTTIAVKMNCIH